MSVKKVKEEKSKKGTKYLHTAPKKQKSSVPSHRGYPSDVIKSQLKLGKLHIAPGNPKFKSKGRPTEKNLRFKMQSKMRKNSTENKVFKKVLNKKERRALKVKSKKYSELVSQLLKKWEILRRDDTPKNQKFKIIHEILEESKGKLSDLCMAHDTSRIMESVIQYATEAQRWSVFQEIRPHLILLTKSQYAKFVMIKLIKYGDKEHRLELIKNYRNRIARLVKHKHACEIVDTLYNDYANATQRVEMMQELYGNRHALRLAENQVHSLSDALSLNKDRATLILHNLTDMLITMISKGLNKYSIVQHLLLEYLQCSISHVQLNYDTKRDPVESSSKATTPQSVVPLLIDDPTASNESTTDRVPKTLEDNFVTLLESIIEGNIVSMLHTRDGVRVGLRVLWASNLRLRKMLVKNMKTCVLNVATNEHGHLFLIGLIDAVDDMILLEKFIINELVEDLEAAVQHPNSRKVLLYALSPRDRRHFSPQFIKSLFEDGDSNPFTKKSLGVRAMELRNPRFKILPALLHLSRTSLVELFIGDPSNSGDLTSIDRGRLVLLAEILIKSMAYHLDADKVIPTYQRLHALDSSTVEQSSSVLTITPEDRQFITNLRYATLKNIVEVLLAPEFHIVDTEPNNSHVDRNELRIERRKRALQLIESSIAKQRKPVITPFTSNSRPKDDGDDDEEDDDAENRTSCAQSAKIPPELAPNSGPFIDRAEGQLFILRILKEEKRTGEVVFGRLILDHVPASNLRLWTRCNRSCFVLVNLFELGDISVSEKLRKLLKPCIQELSISPISAAKILLKHLINTV